MGLLMAEYIIRSHLHDKTRYHVNDNKIKTGDSLRSKTGEAFVIKVLYAVTVFDSNKLLLKHQRTELDMTTETTVILSIKTLYYIFTASMLVIY